jgi:hypothetical protein
VTAPSGARQQVSEKKNSIPNHEDGAVAVLAVSYTCCTCVPILGHDEKRQEAKATTGRRQYYSRESVRNIIIVSPTRPQLVTRMNVLRYGFSAACMEAQKVFLVGMVQ